MTSSNYQTNAVDLDSTYILGNDPNYIGIQSAVTNRKTVIFGQQLLTQTYPVGNVNTAINYAQTLPGIAVDQDSTVITGVGPTSVFYKSRANASQNLIRANFSLAENYPQTLLWLTNPLINWSSPVQVGALSNWTQVSASATNTQISFALQNNGTLWSCGYGGRGALGNNSTALSNPSFGQYTIGPDATGPIRSWAQVASGQSFTIATQSNGTLWAWGTSSSYGEAGLNTTANCSSPAQIGTASNWSKIACSYLATGAIQSNGSLWVWGQNRYGNLGNNSSQISPGFSSPIQVGSLSLWTSITVGTQNMLAIQSNGTLWAWGSNGWGVIGNNTGSNVFSSPVQVGTALWTQISCGYTSVVGIQSNGTLWGWGANSFGPVGTTLAFAYSSPIQIGTSSTWVQVSVGSRNTMAIQSNGTLWSWGCNSFGQLGINNNSTTLIVSTPVQVGSLSNWSRVAVASGYALAIQSDGTLWVWGNNSYANGTYGNLGLTPTAISVTKVTYGL